jgi:hypothetical protein
MFLQRFGVLPLVGRSPCLTVCCTTASTLKTTAPQGKGVGVQGTMASEMMVMNKKINALLVRQWLQIKRNSNHSCNSNEMEVETIMIRLCEAALHLAPWPSAAAPAAPPAASAAPCPTPASRYHETVSAAQRQAAARLLEKHRVLLELQPHAVGLSPCNSSARGDVSKSSA